MCLLLGLLRQPGEKKRASSSKGSSSLLADLAPTLPTLSSVNSAHSVNSKTIGITNRTIDNTVTLHGMAHSCIELCKPFHHDKAVIHEEGLYHNACKCRITV